MNDNYFVDSYLDLRKQAKRMGYSIAYIIVPNPGNAEISVARPRKNMKVSELDELLRFFLENAKSYEVLPPGQQHPVWEKVIVGWTSKKYFRFDLDGESWVEATLVKFNEVID